MGVGDREASGGRKPSSDAALDEWTSCPTCGTRTKRKNLKRHIKNKHKKKRVNAKDDHRDEGSGPRPGRKPSPRYPSLSGHSNDEISGRLATINRELKTLVPGFHAERMAALLREKRVLVGELSARKASGLSRQWGRWYGGPGKVRHYRGRPG